MTESTSKWKKKKLRHPVELKQADIMPKSDGDATDLVLHSGKSLLSSAGRSDEDPVMVGFDTQAGAGVTNKAELFPGGINREHEFRVKAWDNSIQNIQESGFSVFGHLMSSTLTDCTILCGHDMYENFNITWSITELQCLCVCKHDPSIRLVFKSTPKNKLLMCAIDRVTWKKICSIKADVLHTHTEHELTMRRYSFNATSYKRILEAINAHIWSGHASMETLVMTSRLNILTDMPFSYRDVEHMCLISDEECAICQMAKATWSSKNPYRSAPKTPRLTDAKLREETTETLGIDLMFIHGQIYLVTVGKNVGWGHIVMVSAKSSSGRKKNASQEAADITSITHALTAIIADYTKNSIEVKSFSMEKKSRYGEDPDEPPLVVGGLESDHEPAVVAAAKVFLAQGGIKTEFVTPGDHVYYVERYIRVIRERFNAVTLGLKWRMPLSMQPHLANHVVMMLNILYTDRNPDSPWWTMKRTRLSYRDLSATSFGDPVIAYRPGTKKKSDKNLDAVSNADMGLSMGPDPHIRGNILFMHLNKMGGASIVVSRKIFVVSPDLDVLEYPGFVRNKKYVPSRKLNVGFRTFLTRKHEDRERDIGDHQIAETPTEDVGVKHSAASFLINEVESYTGSTTDVKSVEMFPVPVSIADANNPNSRLKSINKYTDDSRLKSINKYKDNSRLKSINKYKDNSRLKSINKYTDNSRLKSINKYTDNSRLKSINKYTDNSRLKSINKYTDSKLQSINECTTSGEDLYEINEYLGNMTLNCDTYVAEANGEEFEFDTDDTSDIDEPIAMNVRMAYIQSHVGISAVKAHRTMNWSKAVQLHGAEAYEAIDKEVDQIIGICDPTLNNPSDYHRCHDLFDIKHDGKKKARAVAGKTVYGSVFDYGVPLYSPTIDMKLLFIMLSICVQLDHDLEVWDVKGAFLQSPMLTKNIHVKIPKHLVSYFLNLKPEWKKFLKPDGSLMVVVKKAWYGLSAASSLWNIEITNSLKQCGYKQHSMVPCLFYKIIRGVYCYIMLHVDDMGVIMPRDGIERNRVKNRLETKYGKLETQSGDHVRYIGIDLYRNRGCPQGDRFEMSMRTRLMELATAMGVTQHITSKGKATNPALNKHFSDSTLEEDNDKYEDITGYRSLVMTEMYISLVYPMVKFHVNFLSTKQSSPSKNEWNKAMHVLQYMVDLGEHPMYVYGMGEGPLYMYVFTDASFSTHLDSKSQSGVAIFFGNAGCSVYSSSNKQHSTAGSSTGAEAIAAESGVYLGNYFREVLDEIDYRVTVIQLQDNEACVTLVDTGCRSYDKKLKHTVRKLNFMHEYFGNADNRSVLVWVRTLQMLADIMTKDLWHKLFSRMSSHLTGRTRSLFMDE